MSVLVSCEAGGDLAPPQLTLARTADRERPGTIAALKRKPRAKRSAKARLLPGRLPDTLPYDASARYAAARIADQLHVGLIANPHSLDLIDVTRSLRHRQLFPPLTRNWPAEDRQRLIDLIYQPYRQQVRQAIRTALVRSAYVIHLSVRTFDLLDNGKHRRADVGLLYDSAKSDEVNLCLDWIDEMYDDVPMLRVRRNYPRRGTTDSITKAMRSEFSEQQYLGIELMLNRAWAKRDVAVRDQAIDGICWSLQTTLGASESKAA
jgi:hypothetical protein